MLNFSKFGGIVPVLMIWRILYKYFWSVLRSWISSSDNSGKSTPSMTVKSGSNGRSKTFVSNFPIGPVHESFPDVLPSTASNKCLRGNSLVCNAHKTLMRFLSKKFSILFITPFVRPLFTLVESHPRISRCSPIPFSDIKSKINFASNSAPFKSLSAI